MTFCLYADAQYPKGHEAKTAKLAENLVRNSKSGDFNKTYQALRSIQKYEYRLTKDQLVAFYSDIHEAVEEACDRHGLDSKGKEDMKVVIDALFSDELKENVKR